MPKKKRTTSGQFVQLALPLEEIPPELCGHVNRHYIGPGECVCILPQGHDGPHEGEYVNSDGEKMRGAWSDAAGEAVQEAK